MKSQNDFSRWSLAAHAGRATSSLFAMSGKAPLAAGRARKIFFVSASVQSDGSHPSCRAALKRISLGLTPDKEEDKRKYCHKAHQNDSSTPGSIVDLKFQCPTR